MANQRVPDGGGDGAQPGRSHLSQVPQVPVRSPSPLCLPPITPPIFLRKKHSYLHPTYFATHNHIGLYLSPCVYMHTHTEAFSHILIHTCTMCPSC